MEDRAEPEVNELHAGGTIPLDAVVLQQDVLQLKVEVLFKGIATGNTTTGRMKDKIIYVEDGPTST